MHNNQYFLFEGFANPGLRFFGWSVLGVGGEFKSSMITGNQLRQRWFRPSCDGAFSAGPLEFIAALHPQCFDAALVFTQSLLYLTRLRAILIMLRPNAQNRPDHVVVNLNQNNNNNNQGPQEAAPGLQQMWQDLLLMLDRIRRGQNGAGVDQAGVGAPVEENEEEKDLPSHMTQQGVMDKQVYLPEYEGFTWTSSFRRTKLGAEFRRGDGVAQLPRGVVDASFDWWAIHTRLDETDEQRMVKKREYIIWVSALLKKANVGGDEYEVSHQVRALASKMHLEGDEHAYSVLGAVPQFPVKRACILFFFLISTIVTLICNEFFTLFSPLVFLLLSIIIALNTYAPFMHWVWWALRPQKKFHHSTRE